MKNSMLLLVICLSFCFASVAIANEEFSKIEERLLLNPPGAGSSSEEVMIYSRIRNKTIHLAMDNQFDRIENMMFVNTIVESETGTPSQVDDDCD